MRKNNRFLANASLMNIDFCDDLFNTNRVQTANELAVVEEPQSQSCRSYEAPLLDGYEPREMSTNPQKDLRHNLQWPYNLVFFGVGSNN